MALVAALYLARAGWKTLYLAAQALLGQSTLRKALVGAAAAGVSVAALLWRNRRATDGAHTAEGDGAPPETPYRRLAESQGNVLGYELKTLPRSGLMVMALRSRTLRV